MLIFELTQLNNNINAEYNYVKLIPNYECQEAERYTINYIALKHIRHSPFHRRHGLDTTIAVEKPWNLLEQTTISMRTTAYKQTNRNIARY